MPEVHVVAGRKPDPGPLGPSPAVPPFLGASVEPDLAARLTMIYGPGSPQKGYFGASVNMGVKGISYIWKAVEAST